jgi:hypothetical protein
MQHILQYLSQDGDTKLIWDSDKEEEVEAAQEMFDNLKAKGYMAYRVEGKKGDKGEIVNKFDPSLERIIMAPRMVGG